MTTRTNSGSGPGRQRPLDDRPNILYVFTDQQCAGAMSCAGNADLRTPAMDSLARSGVRFDLAYCTYPLCSPSRASMFTGMMPHEVGINGNEQPIAESFRPRELAHVLSRAGYECAYGGKWHVPEISIPEGHGFRSICRFSDWELTDSCIEFIRQPHERPFFLVASYDNPHNICEWSRQQTLPWGPIEDVPTELCPNLPANYALPAYEPEAIQAERMPRPRSIFRGASLTDDDWRHYLHAYYRMVEKVDVEIGRVLDALRQTGLMEQTLVIFSSDHGDGLAAHRWNQKSVLYEESVRVPFILSWEGRVRAGLVDRQHLVSNGLDLYPTICDYAGVEPPGGLPGLSLRPLAEGRQDTGWRDHLVVETLFGPEIGGLGTCGRMVRTARYKYVMYSWGKHREQLIDLEADPGEMVNLAVEARHSDVLAEHRELLANWIERSDDRFSAHQAHPDALPRVPGQEY